MNWFTKLFSGSNDSKQEGYAATSTGGYDPHDPTPFVAEDIFLDNTPPDPQAESTEKPKKENKLISFLNENYAPQGYSDGYEYHSLDILENKKKALKANFRELADMIIDEKRAEVLTLNNHIIDTDGLSERLHRQLVNRINGLQAIIDKLEKEKELSAQDEGLIMKAIHNYRDGFLRGVEDYQTQKLFAGSTGLFD